MDNPTSPGHRCGVLVASWITVDDDLTGMRRAYSVRRLLEADAPAEPSPLFHSWLDEAARTGLPEPNAMVLATADEAGRPSTRHVLLKELDATGFVFFTNLGSRKAGEIAVNPEVSLCFPWFGMERQVVVCGAAAPVARREAAAYWATRPRESQLGAWASHQSTVIASRDVLDARVAEAAARFPDEVPLPEFWGGFRVTPRTVEFWQGGPARLHDRLRYIRAGRGWRLERLAP